MQTLNRGRWMAIALGMALISAAAARPTEPVAADTDPPIRPQRAEERAGALRSGLICELERRNSRLGRETAGRVADGILRCERHQGLPPDLVLAMLWVESSGRAHARSYKGAIGLMQVMPHMYEELGLPGSAAHLESGIEAGCLLLADNIRRLGEDDGISSYFWGSSIGGEGYLRKVRRVRGQVAPRLEGEPSCG